MHMHTGMAVLSALSTSTHHHQNDKSMCVLGCDCNYDLSHNLEWPVQWASITPGNVFGNESPLERLCLASTSLPCD